MSPEAAPSSSSEDKEEIKRLQKELDTLKARIREALIDDPECLVVGKSRISSWIYPEPDGGR